MLRLPPAHYRPQGDYGGGYGDQISRSAQRRLADRIARRHGLTLVSDWPMPLLGLDCFVMVAQAGRTSEATAADLSRDPAVVWSQPMHLYQAQSQSQAQSQAQNQAQNQAQSSDGAGAPPSHNDPLYPAQPAAREWRLASLHRLATGRGVTVAVVDSRVEATHPDLVGQVAILQDFVADRPGGGEAHGTAVAGIIAAKADNGLGVAGVAPHAQLMGLRACWQSAEPAQTTVCNSLSLAQALQFAIAHRAQVINLSLSGPQDPLLSRLLDLATQRGIDVVAAFDRALPRGGFPADHPGVIAVSEDSLARLPAGVYSAPGRDVPTTEPGGRWSLVNGSSYAAAHVSGLMALMRERRRSSGGPLTLVAANAGGGAIDACASLAPAAKPCGCACAFAREEQAGATR
jgi:subtilisin family serine protease